MATYYNEIQSIKLINSPQFAEINNYTAYIDGEVTEEKLNALDIYYIDNSMIKNFTMSVDGNSTVVQWRMTVEPVVDPLIEHDYVVRTRGIAIDISLDNLITNVIYGFGYNADEFTKNEINDLIKEVYEGTDIVGNIVNGIIDLYGRSSYDYNIIDIIQNYLEEYPNIDNPYAIIYKPIPEGQNFITNNDHSEFINNNAGFNNDSALTPALTPIQLKNSLDELYNNDNLFKDILSNSQMIRIGYRIISPTLTRMYVNGYSLLNAQIVASNEGDNLQHYAGNVTNVKGGMWVISSGSSISFSGDSWDYEKNNVSSIFYNYPRTEFHAMTGLDDTASVGVANWIDSIGNTTVSTAIRPISTNHTPWYNSSSSYVPVGDNPIIGSEPTIDTQTIIREGKPPVIIRPKPIRGVTPVPEIDDESDETEEDLPNEPFSGYNVFYIEPQDARKFYTWLWNRDNWHEKQELNMNPTEAIISYHSLPLPTNVLRKTLLGTMSEGPWYDMENKEAIVMGFLLAKDENGDDITSAPVTNRFVRFSFGKVLVERTYGDYRDFDREIYIYLPYIGFRQLRCDDVTPYKAYYSVEIYLDYDIDVYSGDFVAQITINKNTPDKKLLYCFEGNMATNIPLTASDKSALYNARKQGLAGITSMLAGGAMMAFGLYSSNPQLISSGALAGTAGAVSGFNSVFSKNTDNMATALRSGSLGYNLGNLCPRTPYIVINSPIAYDTNYEPFAGKPSNLTIQLGQLSGFTRCKAVHVDTMNGISQQEKDEIEALLLSGVIL